MEKLIFGLLYVIQANLALNDRYYLYLAVFKSFSIFQMYEV